MVDPEERTPWTLGWRFRVERLWARTGGPIRRPIRCDGVDGLTNLDLIGFDPGNFYMAAPAAPYEEVV